MRLAVLVNHTGTHLLAWKKKNLLFQPPVYHKWLTYDWLDGQVTLGTNLQVVS